MLTHLSEIENLKSCEENCGPFFRVLTALFQNNEYNDNCNGGDEYDDVIEGNEVIEGNDGAMTSPEEVITPPEENEENNVPNEKKEEEEEVKENKDEEEKEEKAEEAKTKHPEQGNIGTQNASFRLTSKFTNTTNTLR